MASLATSATRRERSHARPPGYHDPSALERVPELPIGRVVRRRAGGVRCESSVRSSGLCRTACAKVAALRTA